MSGADWLEIAALVAYLLSPEALYLYHVQSWSEQVDQLIRDGNWLEALAAALENWCEILSDKLFPFDVMIVLNVQQDV